MFLKLKNNHPYLFAIVVYLIFMVCMNIGSAVFYGISLAISLDKGMADALSTLVGELVAALVLLLVLKKTGMFSLLSKKGKGFFAGLIVGAYCLVFIMLIFIRGLMGDEDTNGLTINFTVTSVVFIISMFAIGITEEIAARALIGETMLEHFGTTHVDIIKAALVTGAIFGGMHVTNMLVAPVDTTIYQMILCFTGGTLYTAIYYRSGNLWSIAFIHGLNDAGAGMVTWLYQGGVEATEQASAITAGDMIYIVAIGVVELAVAFFLLRKSKVQEVQTYWPEVAAAQNATEPQAVTNTQVATADQTVTDTQTAAEQKAAAADTLEDIQNK